MGWGTGNSRQQRGSGILATALVALLILLSVLHMKAAALRGATCVAGGGYHG